MQATPQRPEILLDQVRRDAERFHGTSECARLEAGAGVSVEDHDMHTRISGSAAEAVEELFGHDGPIGLTIEG
jgi:hypothetical protein